MRVAIGQINATVGDIEGNYSKIVDYIDRGKSQADIIVFPELSLTGYPPQDLLLQDSFISKAKTFLDKIISRKNGVVVIVGSIRKEGEKMFNSAFVISDNAELQYIDKTLLPTYDVFDERRYFSESIKNKVVKVDGLGGVCTLGIQICEDLWDDDYDRKVSDVLNEMGADIFINISASPYYINKKTERIKLVSSKVSAYGKPFIYVNMVGAQDELIFDGSSFCINSDGQLIGICNSFDEDLLAIDTEKKESVEVEPYDKCYELFSGLSLGISDYFRKSNHSKAVIGLSGGIDSSLTASIAAESIGPDNILGVFMPTKFSSSASREDARKLADALGISFHEIDIDGLYEAISSTISKVVGESLNDIAEQNIQSRIRGMILMTLSNQHNGLVLNTGNKTELALGYCTIYGDMVGSISVIGDLNKIEVYELSRWINSNYGSPIPNRVLTRKPSAELKENQEDPFDYDAISPLIDKIVGLEPDLINGAYPENIIQDTVGKVARSEYKRRQAPIAIKVSRKAFGRGRRFPIINGYRND